MQHNPLDAVRGIAAGEPAHYYGAALQRSCILARLMRGPASRPALELHCAAPSVTKRISELRRQGFNIASGWASVSGPGGTAQVVTVYCLAVPDDRQANLFGEGVAE
jgi:Helix-turn-helix domain